MIKLKTIIANNFASYETLELDFPEHGIMLFYGHNGAGKSALIEMFMWTIWGKFLRASSTMWNPTGKDGHVRLNLEDNNQKLTLVRRNKGDKTELLIHPDTLQRKNISQTQDVIKELVGKQEYFTYSNLFSKEFVEAFSTAHDAVKKRMLEDIFGFLVVEKLHGSVKEEARKNENVLEVMATKIENAENNLVKVKDKLESWEEGSPESKETLCELRTRLEELTTQRASYGEGPDERIVQLRTLRNKLEAKETELTPRWRNAVDKYVATKTVLEGLERSLQAIRKLKSAECPTCLTPLKNKPEVESKWYRKVDDADKKMKLAQKEAEEERLHVQQVKKQIEELSSEIDSERESGKDAELKKQTLNTQIIRLEERIKQEEQKEKYRLERIREFKDDIVKLEKEHDQCAKEFEMADKDRMMYDALKEVTSTKGVRTHLMEALLASLSERTNTILETLFPGVAINISSTRMLKKGTTVGEMEMRLKGADSDTYYGLSTGEKRRIDAGIMLALSDMLKARADHPSFNLMFFDEVMDIMDRKGKSAMAHWLTKQASLGNVIVVITHDEEIQSYFPEAEVYSVMKPDKGQAKIRRIK